MELLSENKVHSQQALNVKGISFTFGEKIMHFYHLGTHFSKPQSKLFINTKLEYNSSVQYFTHTLLYVEIPNMIPKVKQTKSI